MMMVDREETTALSAGSVVSLAGDRHGRAVDGVAGAVWITQSGDAQDYLLRAGETWRTRRNGLIVIQSLTDACVHVHPPAERPRPLASPPPPRLAMHRH